MPKLTGGEAIYVAVEIDGKTYNVKVNPATNRPIGRPPADPGAREAWEYLKHEAVKAAVNGDTIEYSKPEPIPEKSDEERLSDIESRFNTLKKMTHATCQGQFRSLVVSGAAGMGKTYTVEEILEFYSQDEGLTVEIVKGMISPVNVYKLLYKNRLKGSIILLDDCDNALFNDDAVNLLKAALDTSAKRKISWKKESHALNDEELGQVPTTFSYEGSMIFITNLDFQNMCDRGTGKVIPHLKAIMDRAVYLDLKLHRARDIQLWVRRMVMANDILVNEGLSPEQQEAVLKFLESHENKIREPSIRTAMKLAGFVLMDPEGWQTMALDLEVK